MKAALTRIATYFISTSIPTSSRLLYVGLGVAAAMVIAGFLAPLIITILKRRRKTSVYQELILDFANWARIIGSLCLILLFLRYESLPIVMMRIWVYLVMLGGVIWGIILFRGYRTVVPDKKRQDILKERYEKYLPTARKTH